MPRLSEHLAFLKKILIRRSLVPHYFIMAGLLLLLCDYLLDAGPPPTGQHIHTFQYRGEAFDYLLFLPESYGKTSRDWPLIYYLHGASLRGEDVMQVKRYGLPGMLEEQHDFPFMVLSPQSPRERAWQDTELWISLLEQVMADYAVDADRVYLTGVSLGGGGTWRLAAAFPDRFAAIAPLCGYADPQQAQKFQNLPVWVFHGARDTVVPVSVSEAMVEAIRKAGGSAKFTKFPRAGHNIVEQVYQNNALYDWFLEQER